MQRTGRNVAVLVIIALVAVVLMPLSTGDAGTRSAPVTSASTGNVPTTPVTVHAFRVAVSLATVDYGVRCPAGTDVVDVTVYVLGADGLDMADHSATEHGCLTRGTDPLDSPEWAAVIPELRRVALLG